MCQLRGNVTPPPPSLGFGLLGCAGKSLRLAQLLTDVRG